MKRAVILTAIALIGLLAGCRNKDNPFQQPQSSDPPSEVVTKFQQAGGGDPASMTNQNLHLFLTNHPDLSHSFMLPCLNKETTADGNWLQTPEGRICYLASKVMAERRAARISAQKQPRRAKHPSRHTPSQHGTNQEQ